MLFKSRIAQIFVGLSFLYLVGVVVFTLPEVRNAIRFAESFGGGDASFTSGVYITALQRLVDPVFLFGTAVMIEFLSRIARYLEGIGIMMAQREGSSDDGE